MRDTSDMMEDALSEDTMMECEGDVGGLEDLVDLATDFADSSPTIRDAAERLLTLLGVDEDQDDLLSSSEDEGVELDVDELESESEEQENDRLLHQLAASLAKELKQSYQKPHRTTSLLSKDPILPRDQMDFTGTNYLQLEASSCLQPTQTQNCKEISSRYRDNVPSDKRQKQDAHAASKQEEILQSYQCLEGRLRMDQEAEEGSNVGEQVAASWNAGWDACATEALRYLVEDEGLPPHHPTVLAMKDHLERENVARFVSSSSVISSFQREYQLFKRFCDHSNFIDKCYPTGDEIMETSLQCIAVFRSSISFFPLPGKYAAASFPSRLQTIAPIYLDEEALTPMPPFSELIRKILNELCGIRIPNTFAISIKRFM